MNLTFNFEFILHCIYNNALICNFLNLADMTFLVIILFALTLYFSRNRNRIKSEISKKRGAWFSLLLIVSIGQLILSRYNTQHLFLGVFLILWAIYTYKSRKPKSISWKGWVKVILLVLSSFTYLSSTNSPYNWWPVVIQLVLLIAMIALQGRSVHLIPNAKTWFNKNWISGNNTLSIDQISHNIVGENTSINNGDEENIYSNNLNSDSLNTNEVPGDSNEERKSRILFLTSKKKKKGKKILYWVDGIVLIIIVLPFLVFIMDKAIDGYKHYYHSVQNIGKVEEYDSCCIDTTGYENSSVYDNSYYQSNAYYQEAQSGDTYITDEYYNYNMLDSCAE